MIKNRIKTACLVLCLLTGLLFSCRQRSSNKEDSRSKSAMLIGEASDSNDRAEYCSPTGKTSLIVSAADLSNIPEGKVSHQDMVRIPGGTFLMGATDKEGRPDEYPSHEVKLNGFWMDKHEVTNAQFRKFVEATGYITTAEQKPDWNQMKKQLPPGTPKPPDSVLVPGALVFSPPSHPVPLNNPARWWKWLPGADWRHPEGRGSSIKGKDNYPVVDISWYGVETYCKWAGKRFPTEPEWEFAARGGLSEKKYPCGNQNPESGKPKANTWQGDFLNKNTDWDSYYGTAPVMSFPPNGYGLYDMAGNVWEWCSDWYSAVYYQTLVGKVTVNPQGPQESDDPMQPTVPVKVIRGGSFMCNPSYCKGYRVTSRMMSLEDSGLGNLGFRCASSN